jgi:orotidine-5'-phosphate decarboxylase
LINIVLGLILLHREESQKMEEIGKRILTALDFPTLYEAMPVVNLLRGKVGFKVGLEINISVGTPVVVNAVGKDVFLDLKIHDIPNTAASAIKAAALHQVKMINVHCLGGKAMMEAASREACEVFVDGQRFYRPLLVGVTILTSHDRGSLDQIGIDPNLSIEKIVEKLAILAAESNLDGVVCSAQEITTVRKAVCNDDFIIVTPGIRRKIDPPDDQKRTMSAAEAIGLGATYLVIGRPITKSADPVAAVEGFITEISQG